MATLIDLPAWLRPTVNADEKHGAELLEQFYSTLRVMYLAARQDTGPESSTTEIDKKIRQLLGEEAPHSWRSAYEIEQLLSFIMTEEQLSSELPRRLEEAKTLRLPYVSEVGELAAKLNDLKTKRALLQRLLNDLQWFYSKRMELRLEGRRFLVRVCALFLITFLISFLIIAVQFFAQPREPMERADEVTGNNSSGAPTDQEIPYNLNDNEEAR